jgi:hypothetical protein
MLKLSKVNHNVTEPEFEYLTICLDNHSKLLRSVIGIVLNAMTA